MQSPNKSCRRPATDVQYYAPQYDYYASGVKNSKLASSYNYNYGDYAAIEYNSASQSTQFGYDSYLSYRSKNLSTSARYSYVQAESTGLSKIDYFIAMEAYKAKNYEIYKKRNEELSLFQAREKSKMLEHDLAVMKERKDFLESKVAYLTDYLAEERKKRAEAYSEYRLAQFDIAKYYEKADAGYRYVALLRYQLFGQASKYKASIDSLMATIHTMEAQPQNSYLVDMCNEIANSLKISAPLYTLTNPDMYYLETSDKIQLSGYAKSREEVSSEENAAQIEVK